MNDSNRQAFAAPDVVRHYERRSDLPPAEAVLCERLTAAVSGRLADGHQVAMLDVGVGGGRTTVAFAPRVGRYVGIDYALPMVEACKRRFAGTGYVFHHMDARDMGALGDGEFDYVLFAFNGMDYVDAKGRGQILREIHRVLRTGGVFAFSTHNIRALEALVAPSAGSWLARLGHSRRRKQFLRRNPDVTGPALSDTGIFDDGAFSSRLRTYYARPSSVRSELERQEFALVAAFDLRGADVTASPETSVDPWLYYECSKA